MPALHYYARHCMMRVRTGKDLIILHVCKGEKKREGGMEGTVQRWSEERKVRRRGEGGNGGARRRGRQRKRGDVTSNGQPIGVREGGRKHG